MESGGSADDCHVLVVGYGPVGQFLSLLLARRGWRVTVTERQPHPYPLPRAVAFDAQAARVLAAAGLRAELGAIGEPSPDYMVVNGTGRTLLRIGLSPGDEHRWPDSTSMYQPRLEAALTEHGERCASLRVLRGQEALRLVARASHVEVGLRDTGSGAGRTVRARWVVGCDGAGSFVRTAMGASLTDYGFSHDWMACDVVPHHPEEFPACNVQYADPARPRVAVSAGPGRRRWEFMRLAGESAEEFAGVAKAWDLLSLFGVTPANATLVRHAVYTFAARVANRWRRGRVLLAGDAAHQMPPFAGQGMCSGIGDAANLAWKLDLILAGCADENLMDSYEAERAPQARQTVEMSTQLGRIICVTDPAAAAERDRALLARATPATSGKSTSGHGTDAVPGQAMDGRFAHHLSDGAPGRGTGRRVPEVRLGAVGSPEPRMEILGQDFVLLALGVPEALLEAGLAERLRDRSVRLVQVLPAGAAPTVSKEWESVADAGGFLRAWLDGMGARAALIRPDFQVFGVGSDRAETSEVVRELLERVRVPHAGAL
ncbi:3-(3-hydroxyphenyl)propionate hydroxylase [Frankia sp. CcI156]|nr:3-(3-hydroxyphenyl)propionate hydroxylase [Frankia sp. CgIS1]ONH22339.1 3-(3-hydroxyphenyl)propionate hydroxylase [Frankia sp. CcI156]TFE24691.1 bifunctional 3-(3-hydroxy-phenyl)propionate/3-hydroxycinnamic acid hydroxylase [Frankia sp. B2]